MLSIPVTVAPAVPSGPSERPASSSWHSSVSAPPSLFHSDAASPHTPFQAKDMGEFVICTISISSCLFGVLREGLVSVVR